MAYCGFVSIKEVANTQTALSSKSRACSLSLITTSHLNPPANGQAVVFLTGLLEVFISEISLFWQQYRTTLSVIKPSMWSKDRKQTSWLNYILIERQKIILLHIIFTEKITVRIFGFCSVMPYVFVR